ncbi:MAG TPA: thioesterase family protein [Verrucomicrobiae bacterium]|nr:thioesterase family protein [Verrucomicrobiae bacterium]
MTDAEESWAHPSKRYAYHLAVEATLRDTDAFGHVNNGVYVSWIEEVRTKYVFDRRKLKETHELAFILASAKLDFRSPVMMLETVDLFCAPSRVGRSSWDLVYEGRARSDGRLVVEAQSTQVQYDYKERKAVPIPDDWKKILENDRVVT